MSYTIDEQAEMFEIVKELSDTCSRCRWPNTPNCIDCRCKKARLLVDRITKRRLTANKIPGSRNGDEPYDY